MTSDSTADKTWDVIVIGAGIHGAGVAQAAAAEGYRVLLLEQYAQPAQATSSRSSKLIHGGLRYLETAQIALVRECLRERAILLRIAPHLVSLKDFHIPVYRNSSRQPWKIRLGLMLYSLFSLRGFSRLRKQRWRDLDGLLTDDLRAVFSYKDAQTDDAKLTQAVICSAEALGAEIRYHSTVISAETDAPGEVTVHCEQQEHTVSYRARLIINATGPWVADMHQRLTATARSAQQVPAISLVQGAHIVLPFDVSRPYYLEAPQDRRAVFVLPWQQQTMVGTTETVFTGNPAEVAATPGEIQYLLDVHNHYFGRGVTVESVVEHFAGLRVLPDGSGSAFSKPRDTLFVRDDAAHPKVISIVGGKLTAYRATAEKLLRSVKPSLPTRQKIADTRTLLLP